MGVDHQRAQRQENARRLTAVLLLAGTYMIAEAVGGWITNSLALLADAGHMLSDVGALGLSLFAIWVAQRPATPAHTYGYYRAEILAALANGAALGALAIYVVTEAVGRLFTPPEVRAGLMMAIAAGGLGVNLLSLWVLSSGRTENLNVRGAWLHVLGDALGSVGALSAGLAIWALGWRWADPLASIAIALLVLYASWSLLREAVAVLLEGAPGHIDVDQVRNALAGVSGVLRVHDLHVWTISSGMVSLSCHVVAEDGPARPALLHCMNDLLREQFGITHSTIQIEPENFVEHAPCE
jgi:cobalt-zinc-cadmium efflux system protein